MVHLYFLGKTIHIYDYLARGKIQNVIIVQGRTRFLIFIVLQLFYRENNNNNNTNYQVENCGFLQAK